MYFFYGTVYMLVRLPSKVFSGESLQPVYRRSSVNSAILIKDQTKALTWLKKGLRGVAAGYSNWQSLACPSLFTRHRFTCLSESVSFVNEASVVGNLKTNASNNCWFKLKAVFGWRCEKQLWKFMLVGPPFKHRGLQCGAPFHLQRNRRFLLRRCALRCQQAAPR